jgi:hypothetical protein
MAGYWNEIDLKETKEIIENDSFFTRQRDALDEQGGRFSKVNPSSVTGNGPPTFPAIPSGPWADNPVPPDPATDQLGFSVEEVEPVLQPTPDPDSGPVDLLAAGSVERGVGSEGSVRDGFIPDVSLPSTHTDAATPSLVDPPSVGTAAGESVVKPPLSALSPHHSRSKSFRRF